MRAPDHGKLRPWRFALVRGEAIGRLAELVVSCAKAADTPMAAEKEASTRRWLARVPLLIAVACRLDHANQRIPEHERMLATGAAGSEEPPPEPQSLMRNAYSVFGLKKKKQQQ